MAQREVEDVAQQFWKQIKAACNSEGLSDLRTKREQLEILNTSIKQFEVKNVPAPEDLAKLQKSLTDDLKNAEDGLRVLSFLREQLTQMMATIDSYVGPKNS
jgi:hypothetical protein